MVQQLVQRANAQIWPAVMMDDGREGCRRSHFGIYNSLAPDEDVLVFEDDCLIVADNFLAPLKHCHDHDLVYIGVLCRCGPTGSWGTHAMWVSPYARGRMTEWAKQYTDPASTPPFDDMWNRVEHRFKLRVWRPVTDQMYVRQKPGLKSYISGSIRK
jgi:hypothetical protein